MWGTLQHALSTIIYYKITCISWRVHLSCFSLPIMSAELSAKQIPHQSLVLKDKVEHCCKEFSLRDISTTLWDISSLRAVSSKTKLNSQRAVSQTNWKQCVWKNLNDDRDSGKIKVQKYTENAVNKLSVRANLSWPSLKESLERCSQTKNIN